MTQYFEYKDEKSSKFWEITLDGLNITTRYGKIGTEGKETDSSFATDEAAQKEYDKMIRAKTKKGYAEVVKEGAESKPAKKTSTTEKPSPQKELRAAGKFELMLVSDFYEKYADKIVNHDFKDIFTEREYKDSGVLVCEGDVAIPKHLYLANKSISELKETLAIGSLDAFDEGALDYKPSAIIVFGDMILGGSLLNYDEYEPFLYVTGNVSTKNVTAGNTSIFIDGNLAVEEVLHGYYNDGMIVVMGKTTTGLYFEDDHHMGLEGGCKVKYKTFQKAKKEKVLIPDIEEDEILEYLYEGKYIFAASAEPEVQDGNYWLRQVKKNGSRLKKVPKEFLTEEIYLAAITEKSQNYPLVPADILTEDFLIKAADLNSSIASYISADKMTKKIAEVLIQNNGHIIGNIDFSVVDKDLCWMAVKNGASIRNIPYYYLDEDMVCYIIASKEELDSYDIEYMPREYYTLRVLVEIAKRGWLPAYGHAEKYYDETIGISLDTIGLEAIKEDIEVLDQLPGFLITQKVYDEAEKLYSTGDTATRWKEIVERHNLTYYRPRLPEDAAKEIDDDAEHEIRYGYGTRNEKMAFTFYIWSVFYTPEYCEKAVKHIYNKSQNSTVIQYIPEHLVTPEIGMIIAKASNHNFKKMPKSAIDERLCKYILTKSNYDINYIPRELLTEELCRIAISKNVTTEFGESDGSGFSLDSVPYEWRTELVSKEAYESDKRKKHAIPQKYAYVMDK
ncbi:MAG: WGR domain-containing protein [Dysgonomonas sp.]|nr:WGR domain-containing protein [Dysgonomonas sp.]